MKSAYGLSLTLLGLMPGQFWAMTPAETASVLIAYQLREDRELRQRAWELFHLLTPHMSENSDVTPQMLFESMPNSSGVVSEQKPKVTSEQEQERERRRNIPRIQSRR